MGIIEPRLPKGMRDILPQQMVLRQHVLGIVETVFAEFGFEPLVTPAVELTEVLLGKYGSEAEKLIFNVQHPGGKEELALRYDLTVPLSRVVAQYPDLVKPFRRYQIAPVWRAERPQKGRYREFYQCDADVVGAARMIADAEIVALVHTALRRLGFEQFTIVLNDRKILTGIGQYCGVVDAQIPQLYRSVDKLDKIGVNGVRRELAEAGLDEATMDRLFQLLRRPATGSVELLQDLRQEMSDYAIAVEGIDELLELISYLPALGIDEQSYRVDLSMVRGLGYYTGPIFETIVEKPRIGSITGGGRYDGLAGMFSKESLPATGTSFGIERIIDVMTELEMFPPDVRKTTVQVLVSVFSPELRSESLRTIAELRNSGLHCELYYGTDPLGSQIRYALKRGIPFVVILGPDEVAAGKITARNLDDRTQSQVDRGEITALLHGWLNVKRSR